MSTKRRVLVTGARGFIGRAAVAELVGLGHEVHGVSSGEPPRESAAGGAIWHRADLLDHSAASRLMDEVRPDQMLHLAWYAVPGLYWTAIENARWIGASLRLLEAFAAAGGDRAVMAGTCAEYEWGGEWLEEESTPLAPKTLYGACKHATQVAATALAERLDVGLAWARFFFLYGPGESRERLVPAVARALLEGERAAVTEGTQVRDFLHVQDAASACAALLESELRGPVNVGSGVPLAVRELVSAIGAETAASERIDFGGIPLRADDPPRIVADTGRLREGTGFRPRIALDEGIHGTVEWWRAREAAVEPSA